MDEPTKPGQLIIISGPSGAGKSTVVNQLLRQCSLPLILSISATTRPPRSGETDGAFYRFLKKEEFERRRAAGDFLECKEVFGLGYWYGTLKEQVASGLKMGKWVILEIDVQGAMSVLEQVPDAISVFIHPGSTEELERRLRARDTESEEAIQRRLEVALHEMSQSHIYRYQVINETVDSTVEQVCKLLKQHEGDPKGCSKN